MSSVTVSPVSKKVLEVSMVCDGVAPASPTRVGGRVGVWLRAPSPTLLRRGREVPSRTS